MCVKIKISSYGSKHHCILQYNSIHYCILQYNSIPYCILRYDSIHHCILRYDSIYNQETFYFVVKVNLSQLQQENSTTQRRAQKDYTVMGMGGGGRGGGVEGVT